MILMNIHEDDGDDINDNIVDFDDGDDDHIVRRKCRQITSAETILMSLWCSRWNQDADEEGEDDGCSGDC